MTQCKRMLTSRFRWKTWELSSLARLCLGWSTRKHVEICVCVHCRIQFNAYRQQMCRNRTVFPFIESSKYANLRLQWNGAFLTAVEFCIRWKGRRLWISIKKLTVLHINCKAKPIAHQNKLQWTFFIFFTLALHSQSSFFFIKKVVLAWMSSVHRGYVCERWPTVILAIWCDDEIRAFSNRISWTM